LRVSKCSEPAQCRALNCWTLWPPGTTDIWNRLGSQVGG
jgi:hypothetical protein